ncbi:secreted protein [Melampsora americana]|nr:secreted protein [Melampsora americana]
MKFSFNHQVFVLVLVQILFGLPIVKSLTQGGIESSGWIAKDATHLVNRRFNTIKKRQCNPQSPLISGLAAWIPALFRPNLNLGISCPPEDVTRGNSAKTPDPGNTRVTSVSGNVKDEAKEDQQRWLDAHNQYRSTYKVEPLVWNHQLTSAAKSEVSPCVWEHSHGAYGENIAAGQPDIETVVSDWVTGPGEKSVYNPSNPIYSHFTQVVWASTKSISCSKTSCITMKGISLPQSPIIFWACEYFPPGNMMGEFNRNVKAGAGGVPLK